MEINEIVKFLQRNFIGTGKWVTKVHPDEENITTREYHFETTGRVPGYRVYVYDNISSWKNVGIFRIYPDSEIKPTCIVSLTLDTFSSLFKLGEFLCDIGAQSRDAYEYGRWPELDDMRVSKVIEVMDAEMKENAELLNGFSPDFVTILNILAGKLKEGKVLE